VICADCPPFALDEVLEGLQQHLKARRSAEFLTQYQGDRHRGLQRIVSDQGRSPALMLESGLKQCDADFVVVLDDSALPVRSRMSEESAKGG
jgi:urease accessory protein UreE